MLVLSRKVGETIWLDEGIEIVISEVKGEQVKIGIRAPQHISIVRGELRQDISDINTESVMKSTDLLGKLNE